MNDDEDRNELNETVIGKGIGNALKVFRERGLLGKSSFKGRNLDTSLEK